MREKITYEFSRYRRIVASTTYNLAGSDFDMPPHAYFAVINIVFRYASGI